MSGRDPAREPRKGDRWQKNAKGKVMVREVLKVEGDRVTYRNQKDAESSAGLKTFYGWARYAVLTKEGA